MVGNVGNTLVDDSSPDISNGNYSGTRDLDAAGYLLLLTKVNGFCIMSSIGAILSMASTCFLMGPVEQCKKMFDSTRWLTSLFYVGCISLSLISGLILKNAPLALIFLVGQYIAVAWYSLSYIPYARETVIRFFGSCC
ncbi:SFT2-like protein [Dictyocaulus viviparus]|uniref:Vesicle transport protein n=1 Tax=Dictyocaulus viviparus TaxID=29172 RepID=A0A0D8Y757_DICVI|nr:SFT2-like protein [Dictyocaulus viviparus]